MPERRPDPMASVSAIERDLERFGRGLMAIAALAGLLILAGLVLATCHGR